MKHFHSIALALLVGSWAPSALALDEAVISTARELGEKGLVAYDAGRYDEAAQLLLQAYRAVKVPTTARNAARALAKQGKLVAAAELYVQAVHLEPNELWHGKVQQQAQDEATQERASLLLRIARLKISIEGASSKEFTVTVDDIAVPEAILGTDQFADPGVHYVVAKRGAETVKESVSLKEGERGKIVLRFKVATAAGPAPAPATTTETQSSVKIDDKPPKPVAQGKTRRTVGWISVGVGGAGLAVGAITGILLVSKRSSLDDAGCTTVCTDPNQDSNANSFNSLRTVSSAGFIAGGVIAAAGITLLVWPSHSDASVGVRVGPSELALQGRF
jgi:hypothetical protein